MHSPVAQHAAHFTGQALWVWGVTVLPLATVFAIEFTTPCLGGVVCRAVPEGAHDDWSGRWPSCSGLPVC
jgi:hypothetical protein